jgi:hypothetical protein
MGPLKRENCSLASGSDRFRVSLGPFFMAPEHPMASHPPPAPDGTTFSLAPNCRFLALDCRTLAPGSAVVYSVEACVRACVRACVQCARGKRDGGDIKRAASECASVDVRVCGRVRA